MPEWKSVGYLKTSDHGPFGEHTWRYHLQLPSPLNEWDTFDYWEKPRTEHMAATLKPGMVLFDIGAENGWLSVVYASMVGPENMVLVEPSAPMWANIRQTWERNHPVPPLATAQVLAGPATDGSEPLGSVVFDGWPTAADGPLLDHVAYNYLHEHAGQTPVRTVDSLAAWTAVPDAVTVDVEGAELAVLQGAVETLREHRPRVWVSLHPDLMARDYGTTPEQVHALMAEHGYQGTHLGTDHEEHWYFEANR